MTVDSFITNYKMNSIVYNTTAAFVIPWVPEVLSRHARRLVGRRPATSGETARETSGKERLDLPCWMDLEIASKMSITAVVSY